MRYPVLQRVSQSFRLQSFRLQSFPLHSFPVHSLQNAGGVQAKASDVGA